MRWGLITWVGMTMIVAFSGCASVGRMPAATAEGDRISEINRYALWCIRKGMWQEAIAHLQKAIEVDSTAGISYNNLAIGYEYLGRKQEAEQAYLKALSLEPKRRIFRENYLRFQRTWLGLLVEREEEPYERLEDEEKEKEDEFK